MDAQGFFGSLGVGFFIDVGDRSNYFPAIRTLTQLQFPAAISRFAATSVPELRQQKGR